MAAFGAKGPAVESEGKKANAKPKATKGDRTRVSGGLPTPESTPAPEDARVEHDKARQKAEKAASDDNQEDYTDEQKRAVERVFKYRPKDYFQILGIPDPSTKEESKKAYKKLSLLLHPDKNRYKGAVEAFKRKQDSVVLFRTNPKPLVLALI